MRYLVIATSIFLGFNFAVFAKCPDEQILASAFFVGDMKNWKPVNVKNGVQRILGHLGGVHLLRKVNFSPTFETAMKIMGDTKMPNHQGLQVDEEKLQAFTRCSYSLKTPEKN